MDDKLGVTVQEIKNFGQFLFEGRGALQEFVGETMDGESLGMDLTITWIEIALEIAWLCRSRDLDHCDFDDAIAFLRFEADRKSVVQGKSVSVRVTIGGRRFIKQKKYNNKKELKL